MSDPRVSVPVRGRLVPAGPQPNPCGSPFPLCLGWYVTGTQGCDANKPLEALCALLNA